VRNLRLVVALAVLLTAISLGQSSAARKPVPLKGGITLTPFEKQISVVPGDASESFTLTLTNHTSSLQELHLTAHDFGSLNDTGGVLLEGSKAKSYSQKYGLTSWLTLGTDTVDLQPGESADVPVTVENRSSLQPGGHYGAVVASVNSLDDETSNHVVVNQQLLSLLFVKKLGGEHYELKLTGVEQNGNWFHLPNDIKLRFQNPGNVHVTPRGIVRLKSPTGKVLAQGIINSESAYILPETFRELYVPLTRVSSAPPLPGIYHIEVEYRYDGLSKAALKTSAVRYLNIGGIGLILLILLVLVYVLKKRSKKLPKKSSATE